MKWGSGTVSVELHPGSRWCCWLQRRSCHKPAPDGLFVIRCFIVNSICILNLKLQVFYALSSCCTASSPVLEQPQKHQTNRLVAGVTSVKLLQAGWMSGVVATVMLLDLPSPETLCSQDVLVMSLLQVRLSFSFPSVFLSERRKGTTKSKYTTKR